MGLNYIDASMDFKVCYDIVLQNIDILMFEICFPTLCFTEADAELWQVGKTGVHARACTSCGPHGLGRWAVQGAEHRHWVAPPRIEGSCWCTVC